MFDDLYDRLGTKEEGKMYEITKAREGTIVN